MTVEDDSNGKRLRMRDWLEPKISNPKYPGLVWLNKEEKIFRIPWKHGGRHGWSKDTDGRLFREWSEHTGASPKDTKQHKANFRCALNSLRDIRKLPKMGKQKGDDAHRVYQMSPQKSTRKDRTVWIKRRRHGSIAPHTPIYNPNKVDDKSNNQDILANELFKNRSQFADSNFYWTDDPHKTNRTNMEELTLNDPSCCCEVTFRHLYNRQANNDSETQYTKPIVANQPIDSQTSFANWRPSCYFSASTEQEIHPETVGCPNYAYELEIDWCYANRNYHEISNRISGDGYTFQGMEECVGFHNLKDNTFPSKENISNTEARNQTQCHSPELHSAMPSAAVCCFLLLSLIFLSEN